MKSLFRVLTLGHNLAKFQEYSIPPARLRQGSAKSVFTMLIKSTLTMSFIITLKLQKYPIELNFEGPQIQKWNTPTDKTWTVGVKNGVICLLIMFTPRVVVIKMLKIANFLYFLLMIAKNQSQFRQDISAHPKRCYLALLQNAMDHWFLSYHRISVIFADSAVLSIILPSLSHER